MHTSPGRAHRVSRSTVTVRSLIWSKSLMLSSTRSAAKPAICFSRARLGSVFGAKVVISQDDRLEDIDAPYCKPAQRYDEGHDEALAHSGLNAR